MGDRSDIKHHILDLINDGQLCLAKRTLGDECGRRFSKTSINEVNKILLKHDDSGPSSVYSRDQLLELAGLLLCQRKHSKDQKSREELVNHWIKRFAALPPAPRSMLSRDGGLNTLPKPRHGPTPESSNNTPRGPTPQEKPAEAAALARPTTNPRILDDTLPYLDRKDNSRLRDSQESPFLSNSRSRNTGLETPPTTPRRSRVRGKGFVAEEDTPSTQYSDFWSPERSLSGGFNTPSTPEDTLGFEGLPDRRSESPCPRPRRQPSLESVSTVKAPPGTRRLPNEPPRRTRATAACSFTETQEQPTATQPQFTVTHNLRSRCVTAPVNPASPIFEPLKNPATQREVLTDDVTSKDKRGRVYAFTRHSCPGYVKIGLTSRMTSKRFNEIGRCRNHTDDPILLDDPQQENVPYAGKLERLVFADLRAERRREMDCPCGVKHQEMFIISAQEALEVMQKWRKWLLLEPYGEDRKLKPMWKKQVERLFGELNFVERGCERWELFLEGKLLPKRVKKVVDNFEQSIRVGELAVRDGPLRMPPISRVRDVIRRLQDRSSRFIPVVPGRVRAPVLGSRENPIPVPA